MGWVYIMSGWAGGGSGGVGGPVGLYVRGPTRVLGGGPAADLCREPRQPGSRHKIFF
jgi:hypothetical protein